MQWGRSTALGGNRYLQKGGKKKQKRKKNSVNEASRVRRTRSVNCTAASSTSEVSSKKRGRQEKYLPVCLTPPTSRGVQRAKINDATSPQLGRSFRGRKFRNLRRPFRQISKKQWGATRLPDGPSRAMDRPT